VYVALAKPGPPSLLRQLAYQENSPLAGPDVDPEGWKTLETVTIQGKIFDTRVVTVKCSVCSLDVLSEDRMFINAP
jgi:hypothetical protein